MMKNPKPQNSEPSMTTAIVVSLLAHAAFVVIMSAGFFMPSKPQELTETPIMIEFAENAEPTSKKEPDKPLEIKEPEPIDDKPQPAPKALEQPKPAPVKAEKQEEAPPVERVEAKPIKEPEPTPEPVIAEPDPEPEVKPEPKKEAEKPKPKPAPKKPEVKKPEPKKEPEKPKEKETEAEFTSVLKNLADTQPVDTTRDGPKLTQSPTVDRVTTGELAAFQKQLSRCWNILPGASNADMIAVNLTINVNQDRTVRDVQITDKARYQSDPVFRAAADSAIRAIRHQDCTPLDLPLYKYEQWKTITLNFDPRTMF